MIQLFRNIINMSLLGSIAILIILVLRMVLYRVPKKYSYWLWLVAFLRLAIPVSFSFQVNWLQTSGQSPIKAQIISDGVNRSVVMTQIDMVESIVDWTKKIELITMEASGTGLSFSWFSLVAYVWLFGSICFVIYTLIQYGQLFYRITGARREGQIYYTGGSTEAFLFGFIRPKMVIPDQLDEVQQQYVIAHEQVHLQRRDHLVKLLGYLLLMIHWFNPLVWLGYRMFEKDMEMSCDEAVIERLGKEHKVAYSNTLLSLAKNRSTLVSFPCFEKTSIRLRITNVLRYQSTKMTAGIMLLVLTLTIVVGCSLNPYPLPNVPEEPIVLQPEVPGKSERQVQHEDVLMTPYQVYDATAMYQNKVYVSISTAAKNLSSGIYEVDVFTKQYQLLVPIENDQSNLAVYEDKLFYVNDETLYQLDLKTKEHTVFRLEVSELLGVKNHNLLYYSSQRNPSKPSDPIGAGNAYLVDMMIYNFETNKTSNLGEHNVNYNQKYVFAHADYLYIAPHANMDNKPAMLQVAYDTHQIKSIHTNNKYLDIVYQYDQITYFADDMNQSVRALDENGLRVLARDVTLGDNGVAAEDGIYYFTEQQNLYSRLEVLRYDGTKEVISDLYHIADGFEQVYLYDDYLYYLGSVGAGRSNDRKGVFRYDLHDHTIVRLDDPSGGGVTSYRIVGDYMVCAGGSIQVLHIRNEASQ